MNIETIKYRTSSASTEDSERSSQGHPIESTSTILKMLKLIDLRIVTYYSLPTIKLNVKIPTRNTATIGPL